MPEVAIPIAGQVIGGLISSHGASEAADAQTAAANAASATQLSMFNKTQQNLQPYMQTGQYANAALQQLTGLGPSSGGYDYNAYQNALNSYNSGGQQGTGQQATGSSPHTGQGFDGNSPVVISAELPASGHSEAPSYLLSNGQVVSWNQVVSLTGEQPRIGATYSPTNTINQLSGNPTYMGGAVPGYDAQGNPTSGGGNGNAPQLSDYATPGSSNPLNSPLLKSITMDQATLEKTPGYQFNLSQGLKSAQNAAAARGLGVSGAALKAAGTYATGLADNTYQNQFNNAVTNQTNQFNRLYSIANSGQSAAAGLGGIGQQTAANIGSNQIGAGNAQAAGAISSANSIGNAANNAASTYYGNSLINGSSGGGYNAADSSYYNPGTFNQNAYNSGLPWSDVLLKENIRRIGEENGFPIYEFNYIWSPQKFIGVMAQEIMKMVPDAVRKVRGYLAVDYGKLGVDFRKA